MVWGGGEIKEKQQREHPVKCGNWATVSSEEEV